MTDAAYRAKNWLMRADELEEQRKKQIDKIEIIESKINNCVSNYESTGARDPISARAAHEDLIADFSDAKKELERLTSAVLHEDNITLDYIDCISNGKYRAVLIGRHINRKSLLSMSKEKGATYSKTQLYNFYNKALEALAEILERKPPEIIPNKEPKAEPLEIIIQAPA